MFKKFISSALLSVAVDKKARNKLKSLNEKKRYLNKSEGEASLGAPSAQRDKPIQALGKKNSKLKVTALNVHPPETIVPPVTLTEESLTKNRQEPNDTSSASRNRRGSKLERSALIERAMAIRRSKLHILDELDPDQLSKLTTIAIQALNVRIQK